VQVIKFQQFQQLVLQRIGILFSFHFDTLNTYFLSFNNFFRDILDFNHAHAWLVYSEPPPLIIKDLQYTSIKNYSDTTVKYKDINNIYIYTVVYNKLLFITAVLQNRRRILGYNDFCRQRFRDARLLRIRLTGNDN